MAQGSLGLPVLASKGVLSGPFRDLFWPFVRPVTHSHRKLRVWNAKKTNGKWIAMLENIMAPDGPLIYIVFKF